MAIGEEVHERIAKQSVLIIGASPLGSEIAKSLLLHCFGEIIILDDRVVIIDDTKDNFYLTERDIGKKRVDVLVSKLHVFSPSSRIIAISDQFDESIIDKCSFVIVAKPLAFSEICWFNDLCRSKNVGFAYSDCFSYSGMVFIDFGNDFVVKDINGISQVPIRISSISRNNPGILTLVGSKSLFPRETPVKVFGLDSMVELNGKDLILKPLDNNTYEICDTSKFSIFDKENPTGFVIEQQISQTFSFKKFIDCQETEILSTPFRNDNRQIIRKFYLERQHSEDKSTYYTPVMCSLIAAISVSETIKFFSRIYKPIMGQWFLMNHNDLFNLETKKTVNIPSMGTKVCVIGVGAIGCEVAKLIAQEGVDHIDLIDPDSIEESNLNRQILFTDDDINKNKAEAGARVLQERFPSITINAYPHYVNISTSGLFDVNYFRKFDVVFAMVDSFPGRKFISDLCARANIPMITAGISKTSANWETIIPYVTSKYTYQSTNKSSAPSCTIKSFPHKQEHCIEWAKNHLEKILMKSSLCTLSEVFLYAKQYLVQKFNIVIRDLIFYHPKNDTINGIPYWSNHRVFPQPIEPDINDRYQYDLIKSIVMILCEQNHINVPSDINDQLKIIDLAYNWTPPNSPNTEPRENINHSLVSRFDSTKLSHITFVHSASNLRSRNYNLGEISILNAVQVSGNINGITTTVSMVSSSFSVAESLKLRISNQTSYTGYYGLPTSYIMNHRSTIPRIVKVHNSTKEFNEWDSLIFGPNDTLNHIKNSIEIYTNSKLLSWATDEGKIITVPNDEEAPVLANSILGDKYSIEIIPFVENDIDIPPIYIIK